MRLCGLQEIAQLLGVSKQRVGELAVRPDFPRPLARLACGRIWDLDEVEAWLAAWPRKAGHPVRVVVR